MENEIRIETLTPWIEVLCEAGDARARDRLLLEAVLKLGLADGAAIWRRGADGAWREHVARGPADLLPRAGDVDAIARRAIPPDVLPGRRVHVSGDVALALGGITEERERHDVAEALLATYASVSAGASAESWPAPLPASAPAGKEPAESDGPTALEARRMHHDLRNVMTSMRATEDLLTRFAEGLSPEESTRFQEAIERECARAGELLAHGLSATAFRARGAGDGSVTTDRAGGSCRPAQVLDEVLEAERAAFTTAGVEVRRMIDPAARACAGAISVASCARVVQNLLVNARNALARRRVGAGGGCVWVTLERDRRGRFPMLVLIVEDDGPGIAVGDLARVFEEGYSTDPASSGRGLAIVRALVEEAGGEVRAEARTSGGARLRVRLPIALAGVPIAVAGDDVPEVGQDPGES